MIRTHNWLAVDTNKLCITFDAWLTGRPNESLLAHGIFIVTIKHGGGKSF